MNRFGNTKNKKNETSNEIENAAPFHAFFYFIFRYTTVIIFVLILIDYFVFLEYKCLINSNPPNPLIIPKSNENDGTIITIIGTGAFFNNSEIINYDDFFVNIKFSKFMSSCDFIKLNMISSL